MLHLQVQVTTESDKRSYGLVTVKEIRRRVGEILRSRPEPVGELAAYSKLSGDLILVATFRLQSEWQ